MGVANMTFLINRLGEDCSPLQYVRELTQNGIEAIKQLGMDAVGEVIWDVDWNYFDLSEGVYKLCCIDTGAGMTGPEMVEFINKLSSSIHKQSADGNFGVGAKVAAAPRNPHGLARP
jgi:HSP90 family molecular chaperone